MNDSFFTVRNLSNIVTQNTYFIIVAIGLSFVLISGGIDLSVGYQMSLVGVMTRHDDDLWGFPVWAGDRHRLGAWDFPGLVQWLDCHADKDLPLIVTLATSVIFQGVSYIVSQARTFRDYPEAFQDITKAAIGWDDLRCLAGHLHRGLSLRRLLPDHVGYQSSSLGGNEEALRLAGVNTRRIKTLVYTICGFFTALATMVMVSKANSCSHRSARGRSSPR